MKYLNRIVASFLFGTLCMTSVTILEGQRGRGEAGRKVQKPRRQVIRRPAYRPAYMPSMMPGVSSAAGTLNAGLIAQRTQKLSGMLMDRSYNQYVTEINNIVDKTTLDQIHGIAAPLKQFASMAQSKGADNTDRWDTLIQFAIKIKKCFFVDPTFLETIKGIVEAILTNATQKLPGKLMPASKFDRIITKVTTLLSGIIRPITLTAQEQQIMQQVRAGTYRPPAVAGMPGAPMPGMPGAAPYPGAPMPGMPGAAPYPGTPMPGMPGAAPYPGRPPVYPGGVQPSAPPYPGTTPVYPGGVQPSAPPYPGVQPIRPYGKADSTKAIEEKIEKTDDAPKDKKLLAMYAPGIPPRPYPGGVQPSAPPYPGTVAQPYPGGVQPSASPYPGTVPGAIPGAVPGAVMLRMGDPQQIMIQQLCAGLLPQIDSFLAAAGMKSTSKRAATLQSLATVVDHVRAIAQGRMVPGQLPAISDAELTQLTEKIKRHNNADRTAISDVATRVAQSKDENLYIKFIDAAMAENVIPDEKLFADGDKYVASVDGVRQLMDAAPDKTVFKGAAGAKLETYYNLISRPPKFKNKNKKRINAHNAFKNIYDSVMMAMGKGAPAGAAPGAAPGVASHSEAYIQERLTKLQAQTGRGNTKEYVLLVNEVVQQLQTDPNAKTLTVLKNFVEDARAKQDLPRFFFNKNKRKKAFQALEAAAR